MKNEKNESQLTWVIWGTVPIVFVSLGYIASDFYFGEDRLFVSALLALIITCIFILVSLIATYKVKGLYRLFPLLGALMGIASCTWYFFVLAFLDYY